MGRKPFFSSVGDGTVVDKWSKVIVRLGQEIFAPTVSHSDPNALMGL